MFTKITSMALMLLTTSVLAQDIPSFDINLDNPPEKRFYEVGSYYKKEIHDLAILIKEEIPKPIIDLFDMFYPIQHFVNKEHWGELQGIVDGVDSKEVTMSLAVLINTLYEIEAWCTSVIVRRPDGVIIHQRNLDFEIADVFRKVVH